MLLHELRAILKSSTSASATSSSACPTAREIDRAHDLKTLVEKLQTVPGGEPRPTTASGTTSRTGSRRAPSSPWPSAAPAQGLRLRRPGGAAPGPDPRRSASTGSERDRVIVADFDRDDFDPPISIARIGGGSLGGKARGLAFVNRLLNESDVAERFPGVEISVPSCGRAGHRRLRPVPRAERPARLRHRLRRPTRRSSGASWPRRSPPRRCDDLRGLPRAGPTTRWPCAPRACSRTPRTSPSPASTRPTCCPTTTPTSECGSPSWSPRSSGSTPPPSPSRPRPSCEMTAYRLEEEKMAVIIQKLVGARARRPLLSRLRRRGAARTTSTPPRRSRPRTAWSPSPWAWARRWSTAATCLRFCPRYPRHLVSFSSRGRRPQELPARVLRPATSTGRRTEAGDEGSELTGYGLEVAEEDGTLAALGSTYSPDNDVVYDGISRPGRAAGQLRPDPQARASSRWPSSSTPCSKLGPAGTSAPVEIEFAVNLAVPAGDAAGVRLPADAAAGPVARAGGAEDRATCSPPTLICRSSTVLGNGKVSDLRDLVVVDYHRFERPRSREVAEQVARINAELQSEGRPYLLIGVGRWGSADPCLGHPGDLEPDRRGAGDRRGRLQGLPGHAVPGHPLLPEPHVAATSATSPSIPRSGDGFIDWDWLAAQPARGRRWTASGTSDWSGRWWSR